MDLVGLLRSAGDTISSLSMRAHEALSSMGTDSTAERYALLPELLQWNLDILSEGDKVFAAHLCDLGQGHIFSNWDSPGVNNDKKLALLQQLRTLDAGIVGGLDGYITRAKKLLATAKNGDNPFEGWRPEVPQGVGLEPYSDEYRRFEQLGIPFIGKCGFVLVAGGLGERLGFSGIKVALPTQMVTGECYLSHYISQILAMQKRYCRLGLKLPLAIMVSEDTHSHTLALLEREDYFGMDRAQVSLLKQGVVPALSSNSAELSLASAYQIEAKPHGHGDVHALMHTTGTARHWQELGLEYVVFFQDTNGLGFLSLPAMLGVSEDLGLEVNFLSIPRFAKQAMGAITRLVHEDGRAMTANVEYNQLDPLLRATTSPDGDQNDIATGNSPFPGNTNHLLFALAPYVRGLQASRGLMPEFVNPKYKDGSRTVFKKPTRLECMMQDYVKLLPSGAKVGFTSTPGWLSYSPCKNSAQDAAVDAAAGVPAASPLTAESDQYGVYRSLLWRLGVNVEDEAARSILGISGVLGPRIVIHPSCALFPHEIEKRFPQPDQVMISPRSTLVLCGDVTVERLQLDGALSVVAAEGRRAVVRLPKDGCVTNAGHEVQELDGPALRAAAEVDRMRGYVLRTVETKRCEVKTQDPARTWVFTGEAILDAETAADLEADAEVAAEVPQQMRQKGNADSCCSWLGCD